MIDNSVFGTLRAAYVTFGCKLNFAETATVSNLLERKGIMPAAHDEVPDIIVVNTCSVTAVADKKCRQTIRSLARRYPQASIVVTGCYAQLKADEARALPGVEIVVGNDRKRDLPKLIEEWLKERKKTVAVEPAKNFREFEHSCSRGNRTRYFLKVQDGCNYFCSYCAIPFARGRSRSPEIGELVEMARKVAARGGKEIVLTGVNVGDFGWRKQEKFIDLIKRLDDVDGIDRYRISSIEPDLLTEDIISFVARSRSFMPHFHIPLQCGDDDVLRLMRRHYDSALFADKVTAIRALIQDAFIGVDLIVGMRGETHERFERSRVFVANLDISRLHVFPYSERPGTAALEIPYVVAPEEKARRMERMLSLSLEKEKAFSQRFEGTVRPVLIETFDAERGVLLGHTDNYIKTEITAGDARLVNKVVDVRLLSPQLEQGEGYVTQALMI